jgi:hypothetical protein
VNDIIVAHLLSDGCPGCRSLSGSKTTSAYCSIHDCFIRLGTESLTAVESPFNPAASLLASLLLLLLLLPPRKKLIILLKGSDLLDAEAFVPSIDVVADAEADAETGDEV